VLIRPRRDEDLAACAELVREVHTADRYPRFLPANIPSFLAPPDRYGCWVANEDGDVTGHIALVPRSLPAAMELAATALSRWPVLDVDTGLAAAIALYESAGWTRAGEITVRWSDGHTMTEYVYLGPETDQRK